jgi:hypothetical protein
LWIYLHSGTIPDEVNNKLGCYLIEALQDLDGSIVHVSLVVLDVPFLAETLNKRVGLPQVVSGNMREQMVVHLVLKTTTEPVNEPLRNDMSPSDVVGGSHLQLPEVRSSISIVDGHTVVAQTESKSKEQPTGACCQQEKPHGVSSMPLTKEKERRKSVPCASKAAVLALQRKSIVGAYFPYARNRIVQVNWF